MAKADMNNTEITKLIESEELIPCVISVPLSSDHASVYGDSNEQQTEKGQQNLLPDENEKKVYRMHLGTVPGDMAKKLSLEETRSIHTAFINMVKEFLESLKIEHVVLDSESVSYTDSWGIEFYGCLLITCTRKMISGLGALFGLAFRQDSVGIFSCLTDDDDEIHGFFLVSRSSGSPIKTNEALNIMKAVCPHFRDLSGQRDPFGASVEVHAYANQCRSITSNDVLEPVLHKDNPFKYLAYQADKYGAKSFLVDKDHYDEAIEKAGLQSYKLMIKMTQFHAKSFTASSTDKE